MSPTEELLKKKLMAKKFETLFLLECCRNWIWYQDTGNIADCIYDFRNRSGLACFQGLDWLPIVGEVIKQKTMEKFISLCESVQVLLELQK